VRAAVFNGPHSISVADRPDAAIAEPTDAVVRVVLSCVCGSDLWYYRGDSPFEPGPIGHEFIGVVEEVGAEVNEINKGDLVICPFAFSDGTCPHCRHGITSACAAGGFFPANGDGGQGEAVRVPLADGTLVRVPGSGHSDDTMRSLLTLSDVMATGHHAAVCADVKPGIVAAVVGDGAVGLCGVLASARLGAARIIALGHHGERLELARRFGATDVVTARGEQAVSAVRELTAGGAHAVLECVGTQAALDTAVGAVRDGGLVGFVGVPAEGGVVRIGDLFGRNVGVRGGVAPARAYIPDLLVDVLAGRLDPSPVLDVSVDLDGVPDGYRAMDERRATKVLVRP
jgi:hypothetical protein